MVETYEIRREDVSEECDGMFLLWDTAAHLGHRPRDAEVREHAESCDECQRNGNAEL